MPLKRETKDICGYYDESWIQPKHMTRCHHGHPQCWAYDSWQPTRQAPANAGAYLCPKEGL